MRAVWAQRIKYIEEVAIFWKIPDMYFFNYRYIWIVNRVYSVNLVGLIGGCAF